MNKSSDDIVEYRHSNLCRIAYARRRNGSIPAKEFLDSLEKDAYNKFRALFDRMLEHGKIVNSQKFWKLRGNSELWEFKSKPYRIFTFQDGNTWFLTHGFKKDSDDTPPQEIKRGVDIKNEHLSRQKIREKGIQK